jgi:hypothetical protein
VFDVDLENQLDGGSWTPLLTDEWFGANDPATGRIKSKYPESVM